MKIIRNIVIAIVLCVVSFSLVWTGTPDGGSVSPFVDVVVLGATEMGIYYVVCSSVTATQIRPANNERKGIIIENTDSTLSVFLSTYAATSTSGLFRLSAAESLKDEITPYVGAWYGLSAAGSTVAVQVIEKH